VAARLLHPPRHWRLAGSLAAAGKTTQREDLICFFFPFGFTFFFSFTSGWRLCWVEDGGEGGWEVGLVVGGARSVGRRK